MPLLEVKNLKKSFATPGEAGRQDVIQISQFGLNNGEQVALSGPSGSGKTTFLNLIAGILVPDSGTISLDGKHISEMPESGRDRVRAENIGYIFQVFNLLQGFTALENVLLGMTFSGKPDRAYAEQLLKTVGLANRLHYKPKELSTGQQQRVAVARALANKPKLVLADEPTGHLDSTSGSEALELMRKICTDHSAALLIVSHDPVVLAQFPSRFDLTKLNNR